MPNFGQINLQIEIRYRCDNVEHGHIPYKYSSIENYCRLVGLSRQTTCTQIAHMGQRHFENSSDGENYVKFREKKKEKKNEI